jgi:uncharacterized delta-60 repeat protein
MNKNNQPAAPKPLAALELIASRDSENALSNKEFAMIQFPKNKLRFAVISCLLGIAFMSCNTVSNLPQPTSTPNPILGVLEVHVDGGNGAEATASAKMMNASSSSRSITAVSDTGLSLSRREVSFIDVGNPGDLNAMRYVRATFELTNTSRRNFDNLSLVAISLAGNNLGGTAVGALADAQGVPISAYGVARAMMPSHGMQTLRVGLGVNPETADLQFFTEAEAGTVQAQSAQLIPAIVGDVLQYGFVTHNFSGTRAIGASNCAGANCNKGVITLAYKMPLNASRASNPWAFTTYFVVTNQTENFISQSLEEQGRCTVTGQAQFSRSVTSNLKVRTLPGSSYHGINLESLTGIRTAGSSLAPLASLPLPTALSPLSLDSSCFTQGGSVTTPVDSTPNQGHALALTQDGKVFVAGSTFTFIGNGFQEQFLVLKYNPDGTLDQDFGTAGKATASFSRPRPGTTALLLDARADAVALQTDGKVVVAGLIFTDPLKRSSEFALARFNPDGSLDSSFGTNGMLTSNFGSSNQIKAMAIQANGMILVAGIANRTNLHGALQRFTPDGTLDSNFGTAGTLRFAPEIHALKLQTNGKIVIAGGMQNSNRVFVAQLLPNGNTDVGNFGPAGGVIIPINSSLSSMAEALVIQADGKIVLAGNTTNLSSHGTFLTRVTSTGRLDSTFGRNGFVLTPIVPTGDQLSDLAMAPDGTLVSAGSVNNKFKLARYSTSGANLGTTTTGFGPFAAQANALGIRPDGKIVVAGYANNGSNDDVALAQYNP